MEEEVDQFVGLDVSQEQTRLCVIGSDGKIAWQGRCRSTPAAIADALKERAPDAIRIALESGPLSTWHWHALTAMGFPVVCVDARHAKAALNMQVNKTDKNDAHGLAQIVKAGWYREVSVKSLDSHMLRSMLGTRFQLVGMRVDVGNQIRGTLKTFGIVLPRTHRTSLDRLIEERHFAGSPMLQCSLRSLLAAYKAIKDQIKALDRELRACARRSPICRLLMTVPGVGLLTALAFVSTVDDPKRFSRSRSVGAYLGLTPRRYQSGELDANGSISKCGDSLMRAYLFEAATTLLTRVQKWSALKAWGLRLAKRTGMKKAKVAVARKLAVMMHAMWLTGEPFRWLQSEPATT
jgi:transposase